MSLATSARARRAGGLTALTLGAVTLGVPATALAAPADETPDPGAAAQPEAGTEAAEVLTPAPLAAGASPASATAAHFGWGKLEPDLLVSAGSSFPADAELDRTGATFRVTYTKVFDRDTSDTEDFPDGVPVIECTWDEADTDGNGNPCDFTGSEMVIDTDVDGAILFPLSEFTVELVRVPTSGQVLLPAGGRTIAGYTDEDFEGPVAAVFEAPGAYRTLGVTLTGAGGAPVAGATFELCTQPGGTCAAAAPTTASGSAPIAAASPLTVSAVSSAGGQLLFPGLYLPGQYQIRQTASADGSPFSTAPFLLTLAAASSVADTGAPVLLPVSTAPATTPASSTLAAAAPAPAAGASAPASGGSGRLAATGAAPMPVLALGAGLVAAGAVTVGVARRRTR
ncbi:hypothetical protein JKP75_01280 [Blastococcus sp. TML/M2B]|uniref:hypothetical protein n=1 Tax=unclassified Blastococcus TaxID=2619396 RepID=UPI00190B768C|nr:MULTISPECIES: hypothetical protein [unclassified Blastococcus]MBN1091344.1 hypothetical protein [Blastococcus sp. TML/M2B]MBN1095101.1 hypothetical protein [Blastococcus sp. TML/C7B]